MQLKIKIFALLAILMMVLNAWAGSTAPSNTGSDAATRGPQAVFVQTKYEFKPLFEGEEIKHDFVVENKGDAPLVIKNVRPD